MYVREDASTNFDGKRPSGLRIDEKQVLILPAGQSRRPKRPPDPRRTNRKGSRRRVYVREDAPVNFDGKRPLRAGNRRMHGQSLGRRKCPKAQSGPPS